MGQTLALSKAEGFLSAVFEEQGEVTPIALPREIHRHLLAEARAALPNECCGLLGGRGSEVIEIFPCTNQLVSPTAYEIPPEELFQHFRAMREQGLELVGIYHSHPAGENVPSRRDLESAYYPEAAYIIVSPLPEAAAPVRAFRLAGGEWQEIDIKVAGAA